MLVALALLAGASGAALIASVRRFPRLAWALTLAAAASALPALFLAWRNAEPALERHWSASWNLSWRMDMDGLAALYGLLASGIGLLVAAYAGPYIRHHLEKQQRPPRDAAPFFAHLALFMSAMIGLVLTQELFSLFIFWEATAIASAFLIGTDRRSAEARQAALTAVVVTIGASLPLFVAIVLLHVSYGSSRIDVLLTQVAPGPMTDLIAVLILVAAIAKSAQVPLHFWLPRAMVAPTPVSAYLHSAAMVAAGVFLLSRLHGILALSDIALRLLVLIGATSIAVGSLMALTRDKIKEVLAYSTIAQYGYVVAALGIGGHDGAGAAAVYVLPHALAKSALFLAAGVVTQASGGEDRLSHLGGFGRTHPVLTLAAAVAAASLAALPMTAGFFKDEHFFKAVLSWRGSAAPLATLLAAFTAAYTWRWWSAIFLGRTAGARHHVPPLMTAVVAILSLLTLAGGAVPGLWQPLVQDAARAIDPSVAQVEVAYHLDARAENLMALGTWALAVLLILARVHAWSPLARALAFPGPAAWYKAALLGLRRLARWLHDVEGRDLRDRVAAVLVPGGVLIAIAVAVLPRGSLLQVGSVARGDVVLLLALLLVGVSAIGALMPSGQLGLVLAVSMVNYAAALAFGAFGAPDVALVSVLVQTALTILLLAVLRLFPRRALAAAAQAERRGAAREWVVSAVAAVAGFTIVWVILSSAAAPAVGPRYLDLAPKAHAKDVVTAVLADFRGLDTMGEATVVTIALLGVAGLLVWRGDRA